MDMLPNMEEISAQLMLGESEESINDGHAEEGKTHKDGIGELQSLPSPTEDGNMHEMLVSATSPRTKLTLAIHKDGITLTSPKDERIVLQSDAVKHVIFFPKREDCLKKPKTTKDGGYISIPGSLVLIILEEEKVSFRNKTLKQICLQLPEHRSDPIEIADADVRPTEAQLTNACSDSFEEKLVRLFASSLALKNGVRRVYNPKYQNIKQLSPCTYTFQSDDGGANKSIMQGQMPYLKCYQGVNDGVIFPMEEGLLFFKPPLFVHRSELHSIAVGRGGGSRYVDLHATLDGKDGEKTELEFTNIDREEMKVLNAYIHNTLVKAMAKDAEGSDSEEAQNEETVNEEDNADNGGDNSRKRSRRAASMEAQKATKREMASSAQKSAGPKDDESEEEDEDDDYEGREKSDSEEDEDEDAEEHSDDDEEIDASEGESDGTVSEED